MSLISLLMLTVSAALHAGWNLALKQAGERYIATWWALVLSSFCFLPFLAFSRFPAPGITPYILVSAILEVAYFILLIFAYQKGDFSLVYPVARGAAPAFLAIWSVWLLGDQLRPTGILGLVALIVGLVIVGGSTWFGRGSETGVPARSTVLIALAVALLISLYSAVDGAAVKLTEPVPYTALVFAATALLLTPLMVKRYGWNTLKASLLQYWRRVFVIGCLILSSYTLVLVAYSVSPVSYVGAIREISIVFGAVAGWLFLGENLGKIRIIGALVMFVGIIIIATLG
jgi:drug/metabolite transporter (DMT)-like permease